MTSRRVWLGLGGLFTLLVTGYGCLTLVDLLALHRSREPIAIDSLRGVTNVRLRGGGGSVHLRDRDRDGVSGTVRLSATLREPRHREHVEGNTLVLETSCPAFNSLLCSADYTLEIPQGMSIDADLSGGGITIEDVTGVLSLRSSGGDIDVTGATDAVTAASSGGAVRLRRSTSATVEVDSSGGGVTVSLTAVPASLRATSSGGGITVELPTGTTSYAVDANSGGGATTIDVRSDPRSANRIYAHSSGGDVRVRYLETP